MSLFIEIRREERRRVRYDRRLAALEQAMAGQVPPPPPPGPVVAPHGAAPPAPPPAQVLPPAPLLPPAVPADMADVLREQNDLKVENTTLKGRIALLEQQITRLEQQNRAILRHLQIDVESLVPPGKCFVPVFQGVYSHLVYYTLLCRTTTTGISPVSPGVIWSGSF